MNKLTRNPETDSQRERAGGQRWEGFGGGGSSKKEKGLMNMDNSVVIAGERGVAGGRREYKGDKW